MDMLTPKALAAAHNAFDNLGMKLSINKSVYYTGHTDIAKREVTLRQIGQYAYHELGHVVSFAAGNADCSAEWYTIYVKEKSKYIGYDKIYVTGNQAEYFASSFQDYCLRPGILKATRPQTYEYIEKAISKCTPKQIGKMKSLLI